MILEKKTKKKLALWIRSRQKKEIGTPREFKLQLVLFFSLSLLIEFLKMHNYQFMNYEKAQKGEHTQEIHSKYFDYKNLIEISLSYIYCLKAIKIKQNVRKEKRKRKGRKKRLLLYFW